jgi:TetR/AcrR family transcriptional regulator, transcriptional repressor for nem operon
MRKSRVEAAKTRERIVTAAAREFRSHGIEATGLADLMKAAGLTHGGFYKHFESKGQLVAEACAATLTPSEAAAYMPPKAAAKKKGREALKARAAAYLSPGHRDNPQAGCPFAALGSELARADDEARATLTAGLQRGLDLFAEHFDNVSPGEARRRAIVMASLMVGALTLARVVDDPKVSDTILRTGVEAVLRLYAEE